MSSPIPAGALQTHQLTADNQILIHDAIHGSILLHEPALISLLQSPPLQRLRSIHQHGITGFLGLTPRVTRLEHSVGALLLVRHVGGTVSEQAAALLHDVSHTTLSHVVDFAMVKPGEQSYHEAHKARYLGMTRLPEILAEHNLSQTVLDEELIPLVEMPAPRLCADRLDYALRDAVSFGKMSVEDARRVVGALRAFPDARAEERVLVLEEPEVAMLLARAYLACDRDVWSNRAHVDMARRIGEVIGELVKAGAIDDTTLWQVSDAEFWALLRQKANPEQLEVIQKLENEGIPDENVLRLPQGAKIRTLDPDIWRAGDERPVPLSTVLPEWGSERQQYILSRRQQH